MTFDLLGPPTAEEIIKELETEIGFRKRVYGRKVSEGSMSAEVRDRKIMLIEQAIERVRRSDA